MSPGAPAPSAGPALAERRLLRAPAGPVLVPPLVGLRIADAAQVVAGRGLGLRVAGRTYSPRALLERLPHGGWVHAQHPPPGRRVAHVRLRLRDGRLELSGRATTLTLVL